MGNFFPPEISDLRTAISNGRTAVSDGRSAVSNVRTALSDLRTALSDLRTVISNGRTAVSNGRTALADMRTAVSDVRTAVPDVRTAVPDVRTAVSSVRPAVFEVRPAVSEVRTAPSGVRTAVSSVRAALSEAQTAMFDGRSVISDHGAVKSDLQAECFDRTDVMDNASAEPFDRPTQFNDPRWGYFDCAPVPVDRTNAPSIGVTDSVFAVFGQLFLAGDPSRGSRALHSGPCASANAPRGSCERTVRWVRGAVARECLASVDFEGTGEGDRTPFVFHLETFAVKVSALLGFWIAAMATRRLAISLEKRTGPKSVPYVSGMDLPGNSRHVVSAMMRSRRLSSRGRAGSPG